MKSSKHQQHRQCPFDQVVPRMFQQVVERIIVRPYGVDVTMMRDRLPNRGLPYRGGGVRAGNRQKDTVHGIS